jgi:hypothetical protein
MGKLDAITVLTSPGNTPINKVARRALDGTVPKPTMIEHRHHFRARTVLVPDVAALAEVLCEVGERPDQCISLSIFKDAPEDDFTVLPARTLARLLGVAEHDREALAGFHDIEGVPTAARIKQSMELGSWLLFDRDFPDGMPRTLRELSYEEWRAAVDLLIPGFANAGTVVVPSTTGRVVVDGVPFESASSHTFVRIDSVKELKDAWDLACHRALFTEYKSEPLGFTKHHRSKSTGEIVGRSWGTIFDRSVLAPARLVFDGAPVTYGEGLEVVPPIVEVREGPTLERAAFPLLSPRKERVLLESALEQVHGVKPTLEPILRVGKIVGIKQISIHDMSPDLKVMTEHGIMTYDQMEKSDRDHIRCQSPFRESSSWAAYFGRHTDGSGFIFDTGTREKHVLSRASNAAVEEIIRQRLIDDLRPRFRYPNNSVFSDAWGRRVELREIGGATVDLIDLLAHASDAPCDSKGRVNRHMLPRLYRTWLPTSWATMVRALPLADEFEGISEPEIETFREQVATLVTSMYRMSIYGGETRALGSWAYVAARMALGTWARVGGLELWGRIVDDGFLIAFTPRLAKQTTRIFPEIAELSLNQLTRRCRKYGIALEGDNRITCGDHRIRAAILSAEFVASLNLSYDLSDPVAAALQRALNQESPEFGRAGGVLPRGVGGGEVGDG